VKLGVDNRTAVMIRNVPRNYTQPMLFAELVEAIGNAGYNVFMIDYIYMPYDVRQKESSTYVFANVKEAAMIEALYGIFEGPSPLERVVQSVKVRSLVVAELPDAAASTSVRYAKCHGLEAILNSLSRGAAQQLPAWSVGEKTETRVSTEASKIDFALLPTPHLSRHASDGGAPLLLFDS
ncbi:hypothetical protein FOZ62_012397, partial [Perkinsus olseni]